MADDGTKVGELAAATGLTVRTLHYYDEIGPLTPSARTGTGHRRYGAADVQRLYRICLLRRRGLSLEEIAAALDDRAWDLAAAMHRHIDQLDQRLAVSHRLRQRLAAMVTVLDAHGEPATAELLDALEEMRMLDTAGLSIMVDDVDAHYAHAVSEGATIVYEPTDMPYGVREYGTRDLENRLWSFMTPLD